MKDFSYIRLLQRYFFEINAELVLRVMFHPFNLHQSTYKKAGVSYFKLLCKIFEAHQNRTGTSVFFFLSAERATFILPVSLARADRYVLHFSLALPFLPRTTRVDVPVFLLLLAPVFLLVVSPSHRLCASSRCAPASSSSLRFFPSSSLLCLSPAAEWK